MNGDKSPHIMNASTNLVGFSFILLTSLKAFPVGRFTFIDEMTLFAVTGFMVSTLFSFLSIRATDKKASIMYEKVADSVFFGCLLILFFVCLLLTM